MKYKIYSILTDLRDSWHCPEFLRKVIDWLRYEIFYPYD